MNVQYDDPHARYQAKFMTRLFKRMDFQDGRCPLDPERAAAIGRGAIATVPEMLALMQAYRPHVYAAVKNAIERDDTKTNTTSPQLGRNGQHAHG